MHIGELTIGKPKLGRGSQRHDASRLAGGWSQMIGMFGSYQGTGEIAPVAGS